MKNLGRLGEDLVAKLLGFKRQPFSGGRWPHKEDLLKVMVDDRGVAWKELAQVKTTSQKALLAAWDDLERHAGNWARPRYFKVVVIGQRAVIFEVTKVQEVDLGIGGDA